ncbi:hypothetical protein [Halalkalibacter akibai]|uniref:Uncharacterized protein n=1 Tax=Halalkalibacter akibai (strain ATCC 43226 / DSM 21942 / CIP 109018 / JCM 9157 / 1139) TaxID=1236973 RepID=W4QZF3_HALA3|nr:hypothetical protein [Halalkalibacter akibai]GAE36694.1 hypothetical protein JCM9157_3905 [Halalkalibacter akibai JCM 9157]
MTLKNVLQTLGTVFTIVLSFSALRLSMYNKEMEVAYNSKLNLLESGLLFAAVAVMVMTGISYFNSRVEHDGAAYVLHIIVALAHVILLPITLMIADLKVHFGQNWWLALIGVFLLFAWAHRNKEVRN